MISFITAARLCAMADSETRQAGDGKWYRLLTRQAARQARQAQRTLEGRVCDDVGPGASEHTADSDGAVDRGASEHTTHLTKHGGTDSATRQAGDGQWYTEEEFREYYQEHAATMWRQARQAQETLDPRVCDGVGPGASEHTADSDGALDRGASEHTCLLAIRAKELSCGLPAVGVA